jgi:hypothetical protein
VLVNNAALGGQHTVGAFSPEEWEQMFQINVRGPVFLMHAALPYLKEGKHAAALNILSAAGFLNSRWFPIYGPSKAALFGQTRAAAAELAQYGIRVNAIAPGLFATEILLSEPAEIHQYTAQITLLNRIAHRRDGRTGPAIDLRRRKLHHRTGIDGGWRDGRGRLAGGGRFQLDDHFRESETADAQQRGRGPGVPAGEALEEHVVVGEEPVHVGGVDVEANDVAEGSTGFCEDSFEVVERGRELCAQVPGPDDSTVGGYGSLAGAIQQGSGADFDGLGVTEGFLPGPGVDGGVGGAGPIA